MNTRLRILGCIVGAHARRATARFINSVTILALDIHTLRVVVWAVLKD